MSIPIDSEPGTIKAMACPDGATYYQWEGKTTSAQYYLNLPGYSVEKACVWGSPGDDFGNWAPMNAGVGWSSGAAWLSIFPNLPTQPNAKLPYTVEIVGDTLSDKCRYQNGQYCSGANYGTCSPNGCTVCLETPAAWPTRLVALRLTPPDPGLREVRQRLLRSLLGHPAATSDRKPLRLPFDRYPILTTFM